MTRHTRAVFVELVLLVCIEAVVECNQLRIFRFQRFSRASRKVWLKTSLSSNDDKSGSFAQSLAFESSSDFTRAS